ncbi:MAG TPA: nucleotidyltransferase [Verrucomicrobiae bacterium]|nr:nucleotidyltransferase [Verrucomicrobiae bacterium]
MAQNDQALLARLKNGGLEFVVIGGVCAVYHGVPLATFDLDICCPFGVESLGRIEAAVHDLHAVHRLTANKLSLEMTRDVFGQLKNLYLQTDLGKLDCLSEVAGVGNFDEVRKQSVVARFSYGEFRFLGLDALIASKQAAGREHDLTTVKHLLAIKERGARRKI